MSVIGLHARNIRAFASEDIEDGVSGRIVRAGRRISSSVGFRRRCWNPEESSLQIKGNEKEELFNVFKQFVLLLLLLSSLSLSLSRYCGCVGLVRSCNCLGVIGVQGNVFVMVRRFGLLRIVVVVMG